MLSRLSPQGYGLTYVLMASYLRTGLHKHAKEGLLCLLESCTQREFERVRWDRGGWGKGAQGVGARGGLQGQRGGEPSWEVQGGARQGPAGTAPLLPSLAQVLLALGGRARVAAKLRGRLRLSWHYSGRLADVEATYATLGPEALAYQNPALKYAALPPPGALPGVPASR